MFEVLNIVIVGGGLVGIELVGVLVEMKCYVILKDFLELDILKMNINFYEVSLKLLGVMFEEFLKKSYEYLKDLGVNIFLNICVNGYDGSVLLFLNNIIFFIDMVIWIVGVKGVFIEGLLSIFIIGGNRILVNEFN